MPVLVVLLLLALASARLTRLVIDDSITLPLRAWIIKRWGPESRLTELSNCSWCAGMWCAAGLVLFARLTGLVDGWAMAAILVPAVAWVGEMLRAMIEE